MQFYANFAVLTKKSFSHKVSQPKKIAKIVNFVVAFNRGQFIKW